MTDLNEMLKESFREASEKKMWREVGNILIILAAVSTVGILLLF